MYGIPSDFPHDLLKGAALIQVCVGEHQLQLNFDGGQNVSIESCLRIDGGEKLSDFTQAATSICRFLGYQVEESSAPDTKTLKLRFSRGTIEVLDDTLQYESFSIALPDRGIFFV